VKFLKVSSTECKAQLQVPILSSFIEDNISEMEILSNKLSEDEIREMRGGKFTNYAPGIPSHARALYIRFQSPGKKLLFRLMQHGRMETHVFPY
jgi:hypothetical protein